MKVKDILKKINDYKLYIELIEEKNYIILGIYTKNDLIYNDKFRNCDIKNINVQYINNKRTLKLYI